MSSSVAGFVMIVLPGIAAAEPARDAAADRVGVYHWAGERADGVNSGVRELIALNARIVRIVLSARMDIDYNRSKNCIADFRLASALDDTDVRTALLHPELKVIMLTALDGTGFGDCTTHNYLSRDFYSHPVTSRMVDEYSEFVYRLHVLLQGSGKRIVLSNWEGDNDLYCGRADAYASSAEFRTWCNAVYPAVYGGNRGPHDSVEGMVLWMKARYLGVTLGNQRAEREGLNGLDVEVAPEISAVHMLHDRNLESVLYDVIPRVPFDAVSYSSYESIYRDDPAAELAAALDIIRLVSHANAVIIGELGYARSTFGTRLVTLTERAVHGAMAAGAAFVILWNLYDQGPCDDFGLIDGDGKVTELGERYRQGFASVTHDVGRR